MAWYCGRIPLILSGGIGFEFRRPLGLAIVGGLILSQILTLFTTPVVYLYLDRLSRWARGAGKTGENVPAAARPIPFPATE